MQYSTYYTTHARTPEELKDEVCSDLRRRIAALDVYSRTVAKSAAEQARLARASTELEDMFDFWIKLRIVRPKRKRNPAE